MRAGDQGDGRRREPMALIGQADRAAREALGDLLTLTGFLVVEAVSGSNTIELAVRLTPDLVVLDLELPGMRAPHVVRFLKRDSRTKHIPVAVLATSGDEAAIAPAREAGCDLVVGPPMTTGELLDALQRLATRAMRGEGEPASGSSSAGASPTAVPDGPPSGVVAPILVVDDDDAIRDAVASMLREEGYPVVSASNGREALELLERIGTPRLILLDLMMPVMDGYAMLRALKKDERLSHVPIAIITAFVPRQPESAPAAAPVLRKPISRDELLTTVRRMCR